MMIVYISCGFFFSLLCFFFISLILSLSLFHTKAKLLWRNTNYGKIFAIRTAMIFWLFGGWNGMEMTLSTLELCVCVYSESMSDAQRIHFIYLTLYSRRFFLISFLPLYISFLVFVFLHHIFFSLFFIPKLLLLVRSVQPFSLCVSLEHQLTVYTFMLTHFNVSWW